MRKSVLTACLVAAGCATPQIPGSTWATRQWSPPGASLGAMAPSMRGADHLGVIRFQGTPRLRIINERGRIIPAQAIRGLFENAQLTLFPDGRFTLGPEVGIPENFYAGRWDRRRGDISLRGRSLRGGELQGSLVMRGNRAELVAHLEQPGGRDLYVQQTLVRQPIGRFGPGRTSFVPGGWDIWIGNGGDDDD